MSRNIVLEAAELLAANELVWDNDFEGIRKQLSTVLLFQADKPHPSVTGLARIILGENNA
jgi:hypothetical protein